MILRLLKKIWISCFTSNPYRLKRFDEVYRPVLGSAVNEPEPRGFILIREMGRWIAYPRRTTPVPAIINATLPPKQQDANRPAIYKEPDRLVYSITGGHIWGRLGLVYDLEKRCFINESAQEWVINLRRSPYTNTIRFPKPVYLKGITFSCLSNGADGGFYHFLFESMVKMKMVESMMQHIDNFLFNAPATEWKLKWLTRTGIDIKKIIWVDNSGHFQCEQLLFTNKLVTDQQISAWCVNSLKAILKVEKPEQAVADKILWITRNHLNARHITWENKIWEAFPMIIPVDLTAMNDAETIQLMQSATHLIGPHGAGFSNLYLCSRGAMILELYPAGETLKPCYPRLSSICGLEHHTAYLNFEDETDQAYGLHRFIQLLNQFLC